MGAGKLRKDSDSRDSHAGEVSLDVQRLSERVARQGAPGRRQAPKGPGRKDCMQPDAPRGDHDLNPDFFDPQQELTPAAVLVPIVEAREELSVLLTLP